MNAISKILLTLATAATMGSVQAQQHNGAVGEKIQLQMRTHLTGSSIIGLKQEIKKSPYGYLNLQRYKIESVRLVAKSRQGGGTAALAIGSWKSQPKRIYGHPSGFNKPGGFDRIDFQNNSYSSDIGNWQIHLNGNIKVQKVVVNIVPKNIDSGRGSETLICGVQRPRQTQNCQANRRIVNVRLIQDLSQGRGYCQKHETWGFYGTTLWTSNGCRGRFQISYGQVGGGRGRR